MRTRQTADEQLELVRRHKRRIEDAANAKGCRNMNDTKWREVFTVVRESADIAFRIKFLDSEKVFSVSGTWAATDSWTDSGIGPFQHRDIEWIEVVCQEAESHEAKLKGLGHLPLVREGDRLWIYGYG